VGNAINKAGEQAAIAAEIAGPALEQARELTEKVRV
jgi:hypothetical protein